MCHLPCVLGPVACAICPMLYALSLCPLSFLFTMNVNKCIFMLETTHLVVHRTCFGSEYNAYSYCKASLFDFPLINMCSIYAQALKPQQLKKWNVTFVNPNNIAFSYAAISFIYVAKPKRHQLPQLCLSNPQVLLPVCRLHEVWYLCSKAKKALVAFFSPSNE